ncbi:O-antigen ligase family protein [Butyrivibrio sp. WCD2001]|uniref:O-antigen ligase family protein n=1 Tax=Butyrivibrio sp. WCD2001 TaxID=1280681 RepID=UPI00047ABA19|nr:O-antigen ligase family protein [Butyrivibrio sp. WCD2001]
MRQKNKTTGQVIHEYAEMVTRYYLLVMFVVLPLYAPNGFSDIAKQKNVLYRLLSLSFLIIAGVICFSTESICEKGRNIKKKQPLPVLFMVAHLLSATVTWIFSVDHKISFYGNGSWMMGFFAQLLMLTATLLVYHYYIDKKIVWIAAGIGAGVTSLLIVLNRFDIYPINMGNKYPGFISTLGQTNWASMFIACFLGAGLGLFIYIENKIYRMIILLVDAVILAGSWVIGSDTILLVMLTEFFVLFGVCLKKREYMIRFSQLLIMWGIVTEIVYLLVFVLFYNKFVFVDENDSVNSMLKMHIGIFILLAGLLIYGIVYATRNREWKKKALGIAYIILVASIFIAIIVGIIMIVVVTNTPEKAGALANVRMLRFDDDWGTHRGLNWKCSVIAFARMSPIRKIIGMGQGYFQFQLEAFEDLHERVKQMYGGYVLTVAHNEYLNMLIENGILGCLSYIGVLVSSFALLWKRAEEHRLSLMALLALSGYIACSFFFFQHVYATSFMYIFIAIALSEIRGEKA